MSEQARVSVRTARAPVNGLVLVLPGGRSDSFRPASDRQLTRLRMRPFVRTLEPARDRGIEVWTLGYRVRGWNGAAASPVPDARWALAEARDRHGEVPVVLVGHSMGGRTALRCAGEGTVRAVAALAPWLPPEEPVADFTGRDLLLVHGRRDRITDARATRRYAQTVATQPGARVRAAWPDGGHAMLRHPRFWQDLVAGFVLACLAGEPMPGAAANVLAEQPAVQPAGRAE